MSEPPTIHVPPDADPDEAAAITAAVEQWLAAEARAAGDGAAGHGAAQDDPWAGRRFGFAGRLEKLTGEPTRVPKGAPADPWAAMGRLQRD